MGQRVMHEVQQPNLVQRLWRHQRLPFSRDDALLRPARQIQLHAAIHTMHALMVPGMPLVAQPLEAFAEAAATMSRDRFIERADHPQFFDRRGFQALCCNS